MVRPVTAIKSKPISDKCRDHFASGKIAKLAAVDPHRLDSDGYTRLGGDFYLAGRLLRKVLAVLNHAVYNHAYNGIDVLERFGFCRPPG